MAEPGKTGVPLAERPAVFYLFAVTISVGVVALAVVAAVTHARGLLVLVLILTAFNVGMMIGRPQMRRLKRRWKVGHR